MNKIIRELCKVTNFSNLMFVVTEADGKVVSVGNSISKSLITDIHGNIWFDYVAPEDRDRVIEEYRYIAINKKIGEIIEKKNKTRDNKIAFHTDAVQATEYFDMNVNNQKCILDNN